MVVEIPTGPTPCLVLSLCYLQLIPTNVFSAQFLQFQVTKVTPLYAELSLVLTLF